MLGWKREVMVFWKGVSYVTQTRGPSEAVEEQGMLVNPLGVDLLFSILSPVPGSQFEG